ncbi:hypothetical protein [Paenibacillus sp. YAF4_2]|uniref:hypothetical protein n=1 Tax=Paenibacillus sp. YAF4_2 TaxID=3233085 RepID=UPI003F97EEE1
MPIKSSLYSIYIAALFYITSALEILTDNWAHHAGYGYGLGVRTHISKAGSGSLSPLGEFGWSGAAGCFAIIDTESQLTVMYAQHLVNNQEPYVHPRLKNIVYSCLS